MLDNSYKEKNPPQRYYVDGKLYETWDNIPNNYKLDLVVDSTPSIEDTYIRLDFLDWIEFFVLTYFMDLKIFVLN